MVVEGLYRPSEGDGGAFLTGEIFNHSGRRGDEVNGNKACGNQNSAKKSADFKLDIEYSGNKTEETSDKKGEYKTDPGIYTVITAKSEDHRSRKEGSFHCQIGEIENVIGYVISHGDERKYQSTRDKNLCRA